MDLQSVNREGRASAAAVAREELIMPKLGIDIIISILYLLHSSHISELYAKCNLNNVTFN